MIKKNNYLTVALAALTVIVLTSASLRAEDEGKDDSIDLAKVPPAALAALQAKAGSSKITEVEKDDEDGVISYEAKFMVDGKTTEYKVAADGSPVVEKAEGKEDHEDKDKD